MQHHSNDFLGRYFENLCIIDYKKKSKEFAFFTVESEIWTKSRIINLKVSNWTNIVRN